MGLIGCTENRRYIPWRDRLFAAFLSSQRDEEIIRRRNPEIKNLIETQPELDSMSPQALEPELPKLDKAHQITCPIAGSA
jgi:hypothetical protein